MTPATLAATLTPGEPLDAETCEAIKAALEKLARIEAMQPQGHDPARARELAVAPLDMRALRADPDLTGWRTDVLPVHDPDHGPATRARSVRELGKTRRSDHE